ncbi:hypothetical protein QWY31_07625 [Cytophagales bacterium LB-30]|uniref:HPt domain-containing protein n=1 Tax=Shiella aurantiaca TaxID=3058365 RepID=A0ABT8F5X5_9BACT|nr:hypothetical protein [Shiella aurantiaca]MDN4165366.1 hypothetical protein [Shiella aurantiaca]
MQSAIDYSLIQTVCDNDMAFMKEMLESIHQTLPEYFGAYQRGLLEKNSVVAKAECHKIKPLLAYLKQEDFYQQLHTLQSSIEGETLAPLLAEHAKHLESLLVDIQAKMKSLA